jgi:hypothetical protein
MVRPNLEYCASIWNPNHKQSMQKLEMTQRRAAKYTTNNYTTTCSVNEMLQQLKWKTLESRKTKIQLTMFYKIVNNLVDIPADHYRTPSKTRIRTTHSKKMLQYHTRTTLWISVSSPELYLPGICYQQQLLRPPTWYPSSGGWLLFSSKSHRTQMLVSSNED